MMSGAHQRRPSPRELRWFGLSVLVALGLLGAVALIAFGSTRTAVTLWSVGVAIPLVHTLLPPLRRPLYDVWMGALAPVGWVVSHAALGLIYYGLLTPLGVALRLFGRDTLGRRRSAAGSSHWSARPTDDDPERYLRQS